MISRAGGQVDTVGFHDDAPPEAERMRFVSDKIQATGNGPPFALEGLPGSEGGEGKLLASGSAGAAFRTKVGDFVLNERAQQTQVMARGSKDAVLAVGVPAGDAVLEFGLTVEMNFLGALDGPVLEDAVAAWRCMALDGGCVGAATLESARNDSGKSAQGIDGGEVFGIAEFAGNPSG